MQKNIYYLKDVKASKIYSYIQLYPEIIGSKM